MGGTMAKALRSVLFGIAVMGAALASPGVSTAKMGLNQTYRFDVVWSMFPETILAKGALSIKRTATIYSLGLVMSAKLLVPSIDWRGRFVVEGEQEGADLTPKRFLRESIRPKVQETVIVDWIFDPEDTPATVVRREPAFFSDNRDPVDPEKVRNVIDPLSYMARLLTQIEDNNGADCAMNAKTWDGARLAVVRTTTLERVEAARIDCQVFYDDIDGLRRDTPWRAKEENTRRVVRFKKEAGVWRPKWLKIEGDFGGFRSTFTTRIEPDEG